MDIDNVILLIRLYDELCADNIYQHECIYLGSLKNYFTGVSIHLGFIEWGIVRGGTVQVFFDDHYLIQDLNPYISAMGHWKQDNSMASLFNCITEFQEAGIKELDYPSIRPELENVVSIIEDSNNRTISFRIKGFKVVIIEPIN